MDYNKLELLQNDFFERLKHAHTVIDMRLVLDWYYEQRNKLEKETNDTASGCFVPVEK